MSTPATDFCHDSSLAAGEPLLGEAPGPIGTWFFVEDDSAWGGKVPAESAMPVPWKEALAALAKLPDTKVILIRRPKRLQHLQPLQVGRKIIAWHVSCAGGRRLEARVDEPAQLGQRQWLRELADAPLHPLDQPEFFVCTHGARDRCCAKWGMPVYEQLAGPLGAEVWQCSHLGGHRFAATLLAFPAGYSYGRMDAATCEPVMQALRRGEVAAHDKLRGRVFLPAWAQIAEVHALQREPSPFTQVAAVEVTAFAEDHASVTVSWREPTRPASHWLVRKAASTNQALGSCGDEAPRSVATYFVACTD